MANPTGGVRNDVCKAIATSTSIQEESEMVPVKALVYSRVSKDAQERNGVALVELT